MITATVSHEMRTPLNGMLGNLQCAKRCTSLNDLRRYLDRALGAGSVLTSLLDDTLVNFVFDDTSKLLETCVNSGKESEVNFAFASSVPWPPILISPATVTRLGALKDANAL